MRKFAADVVKPKVMEMDEKETMDPAIIKALFDNGVLSQSTCVTRMTEPLSLSFL